MLFASHHRMDTTIKKVNSEASPHGEMGQTYLVAGKQLGMRLWKLLPEDQQLGRPHAREYETVGYVVSGRARLTIGEQRISLEPGDSWLVPAEAEHFYEISEPLVAIEATAPPARMYSRDTH